MAGEEKSSVFYFVPNASKGMQSAKLCSYKIFPFFNWGVPSNANCPIVLYNGSKMVVAAAAATTGSSSG